MNEYLEETESKDELGINLKKLPVNHELIKNERKKDINLIDKQKIFKNEIYDIKNDILLKDNIINSNNNHLYPYDRKNYN